MACVLTMIGPMYYSAPIGSTVTVAIQNVVTQKLGAGTYNLAPCTQVSDTSVSFKVVAGDKALDLAIIGDQNVPEDLDLVEVCGGGATNFLYGYRDDYEDSIRLTIKGV